MATIGKTMRKYTKDQMERLATGNTVSDRETQQFADKAREASQAGLQAQTSMLNRASAANRAGSPVLAGALKQGAKKVAGASADTAVKATGQGQQFAEALKEQRKGQILQMANTQRAQNRADLGMVFDFTASLSPMLAELGLGD